jgi:ATP-dependent Clp protease protease subunit
MGEMVDNVLVGVADYIANMQLPDPTLRNFYRDEDDRVFWLNEEVGNCAQDLIYMIIHCNKEDKGKPVEDRQPIKIFIDSPGGDVTFMWSIINLIDISKTPIYTINYCTSYSAAAEILASGHKRFAFPGSHVMIHNGSASFAGQVDQIESMKKYFDNVCKKSTEHLLSKTKIDPKKLKKRGVTDWFMDENEALDNGVVDQIITDIEEIF